MKKSLIPVAVLIFLIACYIVTFPNFEKSRKPIINAQWRGLILPPVVAKLLSFEFRTVTSDFLFARASQYFGRKIGFGELATTSDVQWLYSNLIVITDLDPYFEDPYYFGNALLTWDAGRYHEANSLLERGMGARTWDWQIPFFIGFNKFYFLKDSKGGADYILEAAKRPGAPAFLPNLAARLYNSAGKTENAIDFLITFWKNEKDKRIKNLYAVRIETLKRMRVIEKAVSAYKTRTGRYPKNLQLLVKAGIIKSIPKDPYGGSFYLAQDGSVMTTSNLAFKQKRPDGDQK